MINRAGDVLLKRILCQEKLMMVLIHIFKTVFSRQVSKPILSLKFSLSIIKGEKCLCLGHVISEGTTSYL